MTKRPAKDCMAGSVVKAGDGNVYIHCGRQASGRIDVFHLMGPFDYADGPTRLLHRYTQLDGSDIVEVQVEAVAVLTATALMYGAMTSGALDWYANRDAKEWSDE